MTDKMLHHPGKFVRANVIPDGVTVTKAAEMLGVGRVALSNFLNGKAALSEKMADRLRKTFDVDREALLEMQRRFDARVAVDPPRKRQARSSAAEFVKITARDIEQWADGNIEARQLLPVLIRRLVSTTTTEVERIDFPGYDNSQRPGWDGRVEGADASAWVPGGSSGWEFGCDKDPQSKANSDYKTRSSLADDEALATTYVQVTPRNWAGKEKWTQARRSEGRWKNVITYDASDLEQWLEHSPATQIWFGRLLSKPIDARALDEYWRWWAGVSSPPISLKIFEDAVAQHSKRILRWLESQSPEGPLVVSAPSKEEACAFIAAAATLNDELMKLHDEGAVIDAPQMMRDLIRVRSGVIPIAITQDAAIELTSARKETCPHSIVVAELNSVTLNEPDIRLELSTFENLRAALSEMNIDDAEIDRLDKQSARSPTILRRLCATSPADRMPGWAKDEVIRAKLAPYVLIGAWDNSVEADRSMVKTLTGVDNNNHLDAEIATIYDRDDAPLWMEGDYRGVVSKLDCLNAVAHHQTPSLLERFFDVATEVLGEEDPSLDLDQENRWAAGLYDKVRIHSSALRESVADTLVMLAVYGDTMLSRRMGYKVSDRVDLFVRDMLYGKTLREWQDRRHDLPRYAEAAPEVFLDVIEEELREGSPAFALLFEPVEGGPLFGECQRTGMLWALELLAWCPNYMLRVVRILAKLCHYELDDNWANKPERVLNEILLFWLPQTTASVEERCEALDILCASYPTIGWRLCVSQISQSLTAVSTSHRPSWRGYASGATNPPNAEIYKFLRHCRDKLLQWQPQNSETLSDLIGCFHAITDDDRAEVTELVRRWLSLDPDDSEIATLREKVRRETRTYRARMRERRRNLSEQYSGINGNDLYKMLQPRDLVQRHKWLFEKDWVEFSGDDLDEERLDFQDRERLIAKDRDAAIVEIFGERGVDGIVELGSECEGSFSIGATFVRVVDDPAAILDLAVRNVSLLKQGQNTRAERTLRGMLAAGLTSEASVLRDAVLAYFETDGDETAQAIILQYAPFERETWDRLTKCGQNVSRLYWVHVMPGWGQFDAGDLDYLINQLIDVGRPRAAFNVAHLDFKNVGTAALIRMLDGIPSSSGNKEHLFLPGAHEITEALKTLSERPDADRHKRLALDFLFIRLISSHADYSFPALMKDIAENPESFVLLLAIAFRRKDQVEDWQKWGLPEDQEERSALASGAYAALSNASRIPGTADDGKIDVTSLRAWINAVRRAAAENDRAEIADQQIGDLLARCSADSNDGLWPCQPIRLMLEELREKEVALGFRIGRHNQISSEIRTVDADRERATAASYRDDAAKIGNEYPFTAKILRDIAKSFDRDAEYWDRDGRVQRRLRY